MVDKKKVRDLAWKYFWKQKAWEIFKFLLVVVAIVFIPLFVGQIVLGTESIMCGDGGGILATCKWYMYWLMGAFIISILVFIRVMMWDWFKGWLERNWIKAEERANKELKEKYKR